jgi:nucleoside-diphosphate-sugar epimerase
MKKALIIGGTGTISLSLTRLLATRPDWKTYLLNRGTHPELIPAGVETLKGDIADTAALRELIAPHQFDAVANFLCYNPDDAEKNVDIFLGKTLQYLHISSCAVYRKPIERYPITEDAPTGNAAWDYALAKSECEETFRRHPDFPLTMVRPSHTYDNRNLPLAIRGQNAWSTITRIEQGKPVIIHGDGASVWTLTHAEDFAVGFLGLMENPAALGQTVNLVSDEALTWEIIYRRIASTLGRPLRALFLTSEEVSRARPSLRGNLLGDKSHSLIFDNSRLRRLAPDFQTRKRFDEGTIRTVLDTMRADPALQIADSEFDAWCDETCARHADRIFEAVS